MYYISYLENPLGGVGASNMTDIVKSIAFCRNNRLINAKSWTSDAVTKFVLIVLIKIPQIFHNIFVQSAQIGQNVEISLKKNPLI